MLYFNHCVSDIPTGNNWTISACDGPLDNVYSTSCHNPAVILYGVSIVNEIKNFLTEPITDEISRKTSLHQEIIVTTSSTQYAIYCIIEDNGYYIIRINSSIKFLFSAMSSSLCNIGLPPNSSSIDTFSSKYIS